jgi:CRP-like cAMP-binding protein
VYRSQSGREVELAILGKGAVLGEMALIDGRPRSASAKALGECSVAVIPADSFLERVKGVPPWFMTIIKMSCQKIRNANRLLQSMGGGRHGINIIFALHYHFARFGPVLDPAATRRRIGNVIGASDQGINHVCGFLHQHRFIDYSPRTLQLVDKERMAEYCDYLRLFIQKLFERTQQPSEQEKRLIMAVARGYPEMVRGTEGTSAEIAGEAFWPLIKSEQLDGAFREVLDAAGAMGIFRLRGRESAEKKEGEAEKANPLAGMTVTVNSGQLKQWYLHFSFNGMVPCM